MMLLVVTHKTKKEHAKLIATPKTLPVNNISLALGTQTCFSISTNINKCTNRKP